METFALVHGACHGAWCWEPLGSELRARGHRVVAVDLPCDDPDADCVRYADVVSTALGGTDDAIVVGHSLGGLTIPLVPAKRLVFLCAFVPRPGRPFLERQEGEPEMYVPGYLETLVWDETGRLYWPDPDTTADRMYSDCEPAVARAATRRLRPQGTRPRLDPAPFEAWPDVEVVSIAAREDRVVSPEWCRWTARARLGVEPVEIAGGHSPMLSRPAELASVLMAVR